MSDRRVASSDEIIALGQTRPLDENDHLGIAKAIRKLYENREAFITDIFSNDAADLQKGTRFCLRGARFFLLGLHSPNHCSSSEIAFANFLGFDYGIESADVMAQFNNCEGYEQVINLLDKKIAEHSA